MAVSDGRFLTAIELFARSGGKPHVEEAAGDNDPDRDIRIQNAFTKAENEPITWLSLCFTLPTSPSGTPSALKDLIADSFQYHLSTFVLTDASEDLIRRHSEVITIYENLRDKKGLVIEGLVRIVDIAALSGTAQPPGRLQTPIKQGRFHGMIPAHDAFHAHHHNGHHDFWCNCRW